MKILVYLEFGMIALAQSGNSFWCLIKKRYSWPNSLTLEGTRGTNTVPCRRCKSILVLISTKVDDSVGNLLTGMLKHETEWATEWWFRTTRRHSEGKYKNYEQKLDNQIYVCIHLMMSKQSLSLTGSSALMNLFPLLPLPIRTMISIWPSNLMKPMSRKR